MRSALSTLKNAAVELIKIFSTLSRMRAICLLFAFFYGKIYIWNLKISLQRTL